MGTVGERFEDEINNEKKARRELYGRSHETSRKLVRQCPAGAESRMPRQAAESGVAANPGRQNLKRGEREHNVRAAVKISELLLTAHRGKRRTKGTLIRELMGGKMGSAEVGEATTYP